jgi:DNA-binding PadR family transcriptional regulator
MREPTISRVYPPDSPGRSSHSYVRWYVDGKRQTKKFTDRTRAELFHQEKLAEHAGHPFNASMLALQKLTVIEKAVQRFASKDDERLLESEAEITRLKEENAQLIHKAPAPKAEGSSPLRNDFRLIRPVLAIDLGVPAALLFEQLCFLIRIGCFRTIDGLQYVTHSSREWADKYFPFYSEWTIERAFKVLEKEKGLIVSKQADGRDNRVKSYRLSPEGSNLLPGLEKAAKCGDATQQNADRKRSNCRLACTEESESTADAVEELRHARLYALATIATDQSDLVEKLKPEFPLHDVRSEIRRYRKYREQRGLQITARTFVDWMLRAEVPLPPPKRASGAAKPISPLITTKDEDQTDPEQEARFLKQFEDRKSRKNAARANAVSV